LSRSLSIAEIQKYGVRFIFLVWLGLTFAALVGLYHLWWNRERITYLGKDIHQQRQEVFRRAGINEAYLAVVEKIGKTWPLNVSYHAKGDHNQLSYIKYLLIPRLPKEAKNYSLEEKNGKLTYGPIFPERIKPIKTPPSLKGFLLSLFFMSGLALLLRGTFRLPNVSFPESIGLSAFILTASVMVSRGFLMEARMGFWVVIISGGLGWILWIRHAKTFLYFTLRQKWRSCLNFHGKHAGYREAFIFFLACLLMGIFLWSVLMSVVVVPDDWDAWAIWGSKAKVLAIGKGPLEDVTLFGHADYPLLWPAVWAFSGWCSGGWEEHWSRAWGPVFMMFAAWQIGAIIRNRNGNAVYGMLGALLFLSVPMVPLLASWSYAEAPLWLFITCAFSRLLLWIQEKEDHHLLMGALAATAAAYTKNEGLFFSAMCLIWLFLASPENTWKVIRRYAVPVFIMYLPWFLWIRGSLGLGARAFDGFKGGMSAVYRALERLPEALEAIGVMWLDIRQWNVVIWFIFVASLWHVLKKQSRKIDFFVPFVLLFAYLIINVFHAEEVHLIMTSWNRLTVQTLSLFLIVIGVNHFPKVFKNTDVMKG